MNIWIFNHYAVTPDLPGGSRHYDLGKELVKRGHAVTIYASGFHHYQHRWMKLPPGELWQIENTDGVKFVWLKTFPYRKNDWRRVLNMVSYTFRVWRLGVLLRLFTKGKVIYDVHEDYSQAIWTKPWLPSSLWGHIAITFGGFERLLARLLDRVITATDEIN